MPPKSARAIRREFLDFFVQRGHREVPSAPVFPQDDPTLLFTNAGMNQFKDVFLGTGRRDYTRAVDTQKCIRVSGKHNDLEEVGHDTYHHTFFEMLGNWSFGDYFKAEAIPWSWELLTRVWKLPKERLWVTVFSGDEALKLPRDEDSARIWRESTDLDPSHLLFFGKKANFWEMGDTGPCGPCTEIHIDRGGPETDPRDGADPRIGVNAGNERFLELWNNVFIEFNRLDAGSLVRLPARHVDTGMGFERIVGVLQGKRSNYDTDVFAPIFARVAELAGKRYGAGNEGVDVAFRVIADHVRAVTSAFADGALPSNTGRGYVLRRLIRRASRYGRQGLGLEEPFLWAVAPAVAETLGEVFSEIPRRIEHVQLLLRAEEEAFGKTLGRGLLRSEELVQRARKAGERELGREAFELYATYGFPRDLVELIARENGLELNASSWVSAEEAHRSKSGSKSKFKQLLSAEELSGLSATRSTYHEPLATCLETGASVQRLLVREGEEGRDVLVLDQSPFYPEAGGQVGDAGTIEAADGSFRFRVLDTQKVGPVVAHVGSAEGFASPGTVVRARVDGERRACTRRNHTATHLLHRALKEVLGEHVGQQGSYVGPDRLRFDFSHPKAVAPEELERIEALVNARVLRNDPVRTTIEDLAAARARGVVAMFGEKYEERVRVLDVGGWSLELCGGTHVSAAGEIGPFVILSEGAIQAGVRRIEALTGEAALAHVQHQRKLLREAARALKAPVEELPARIEQLQGQLRDARKKEKASAKGDVGAAFERVKKALARRGGVSSAVLDLPELDGQGIRELGERVKSLGGDLALVFFGRQDGRVPFLIACEGAALAKGVRAGDLAGELAKLLGGGGGGRPNLAQGQGLDPAAAPRAAAAAEDFLRQKLGE
jgi:alanyl-tRNA synthetase